MKHDNSLTLLYILLSGENKMHMFVLNLPGESDKCLPNLCISGAWHHFNGGDFEMVSRVWAPAELCPSKAHGHIN